MKKFGLISLFGARKQQNRGLGHILAERNTRTPVKMLAGFVIIKAELLANLVSFLTVLGMVLIFEGLPYFTFPEKMKVLMEKVPQIPTHWLRIFGIVAISTGLLIIYLSKYHLS